MDKGFENEEETHLGLEVIEVSVKGYSPVKDNNDKISEVLLEETKLEENDLLNIQFQDKDQVIGFNFNDCFNISSVFTS